MGDVLLGILPRPRVSSAVAPAPLSEVWSQSPRELRGGPLMLDHYHTQRSRAGIEIRCRRCRRVVFNTDARRGPQLEASEGKRAVQEHRCGEAMA